MTFIGRASQIRDIRTFLQGDEDYWVMIITGLECIGKSTLLHKVETSHLKSENIPYISLNFINEEPQTASFSINILEKLVDRIAQHCDQQKVKDFRQRLTEAWPQLIKLSEHPIIIQTLNVQNADVSHVTMTIATQRIEQSYRMIFDMLRRPLRDLLKTFKQDRLVILLDHFEWLSGQADSSIPRKQSTDQWVTNTLLPELHDYLKPRRLFVILASRTRPYFEAIGQDCLNYMRPLPLLDRSEVSNYLDREHISTHLLGPICSLTLGHPFCLYLLCNVIKEQQYGLVYEDDNFPEEGAMERISTQFNDEAWREFALKRVLDRLPRHLSDLLRYLSDLLRYESITDPIHPTNAFSLPLLRFVFDELFKKHGREDYDRIRDDFNKFVQYPCIIRVQQRQDNQTHTIHVILRTIISNYLNKYESKSDELRGYRQRFQEYCNMTYTR